MVAVHNRKPCFPCTSVTTDICAKARDVSGYLGWMFAKYKDVANQDRFRNSVRTKALLGLVGTDLYITVICACGWRMMNDNL